MRYAGEKALQRLDGADARFARALFLLFVIYPIGMLLIKSLLPAEDRSELLL